MKNKISGIILAGGTGSRLRPMTLGVSKHLLPVYDKPMIYYAISLMMLAGIRETVVVCDDSSEDSYRALLGDGSRFGIRVEVVAQSSPSGIPSAIYTAKSIFLADKYFVVLGDNFLYGNEIRRDLNIFIQIPQPAACVLTTVANPSQFGVAKIGDGGGIELFVEKPLTKISNLAVTGIYCFDAEVFSVIESLAPSSRGETEVVDLLSIYNDRQGGVGHLRLGRGHVWMDLGTPSDFVEASQMIASIERYQGVKVACLEEIALSNGWLNSEDIEGAAKYNGRDYMDYLLALSHAESQYNKF